MGADRGYQGVDVVFCGGDVGAGPQATGVRQIANPQPLGTQLLHMLYRGHIALDLKAHQSAGGRHFQQGCDCLLYTSPSPRD